MIRPDVIVCWPRNCDYPLWRQLIHDNRKLFNEVIIVFTETHNGEDYREFIKSAMLRDYIHFVDMQDITGGSDWRDVSIKAGLLHSYNAEWIWFTEQDFFWQEGFWKEVETYVNMGLRVIGVNDGSKRLHPCSLFMKRKVLNEETRKNFGIIPDVSDHFSMIQRDLEDREIPIGIVDNQYYKHLNGLSHNWSLVYRKEKPNWRVEEFNQYLTNCLKVTVPLDSRFTSLASAYLAAVGEEESVKSVKS